MRAFASLLFGISSAVGASIAAASVASYVTAESEASRVTQLKPPIWTAAPMRVDPNAQNYERLPAVLSSYAVADANRPAPQIAMASEEAPPSASQEVLGPTDEHLQWCAAHYRSFDPSTNSYRSYRGEIRTCSSPFDDVDQGVEAGPSIASQASAWCASRYRSYDPQNNTYRTYGGERRICNPSDDLDGRVVSSN